MTAILQISDTHIVPEGAVVSGRLDTADALAQLVNRIISTREQIGPIDAVLVSGDLTDDGAAESYDRFKSLIEPLELPVYVVPGNHDNRDAMRAAFAMDLPPKGALNWSRRIGGICLIGLDTLVEGQGLGTLEPDSLTFLKNALSESAGAPVLLTLHHPPFACGIRFMDNIGLSNKDALQAVLAGYSGGLRLVCGHIHSMVVSDFAGHVAISAPSPCSTFAYDRRHDAQAGFTTERDGCLLHRWDDGFQTIRIGPAAGTGPFPF